MTEQIIRRLDNVYKFGRTITKISSQLVEAVNILESADVSMVRKRILIKNLKNYERLVKQAFKTTKKDYSKIPAANESISEIQGQLEDLLTAAKKYGYKR
jgi:preprotein translocase subunit Sss1